MSRGKYVTGFTDSGWDEVPVPAPPAPAEERAPDSKAIDDGWGSTSAVQPLPKPAAEPTPAPVIAPVVVTPAPINPPEAAAPEPVQPPPPSFSYVACERCGTTVRAAKFCECCGNPIRVAPPRFCPQCGASLRSGIRFCTNCAFPLT